MAFRLIGGPVQRDNDCARFEVSNSPELAAFLEHHPIRQHELLECAKSPRAVAEARNMVAGLQGLLEAAGPMLPGFSAEAVLLMVAYCTIRRGRGGPAAKPDPMQDSSLEESVAARITSNRESATISKLRRKIKQAAERLLGPAAEEAHRAAALRMISTDPTAAPPASSNTPAQSPAAAGSPEALPAAAASFGSAPASTTQPQLRASPGLGVNRLPLKKASSALVQLSRAAQIVRCHSESSFLPGVERAATGLVSHTTLDSRASQLRETGDFMLMLPDTHRRDQQALAQQQQQQPGADSSLGIAAGGREAAGVVGGGLPAAPAAAAAVRVSLNTLPSHSDATSISGTGLCFAGNSALLDTNPGAHTCMAPVGPMAAATGGAVGAQYLPAAPGAAATDGPSNYPAAASLYEMLSPQQQHQQEARQEQAPLMSAWLAASPVVPAADLFATDVQQEHSQALPAAHTGEVGITGSSNISWFDDVVLAELLVASEGQFS